MIRKIGAQTFNTVIKYPINHDICAQVGQLLQPEAQKKHLTLTINTDSAIPPLVYGDGPRLQQIMLNLLRNAIRFSRHGEVSLSASLDRRSDGGVNWEQSLSLGETQRLAMARLFYHQPLYAIM